MLYTPSDCEIVLESLRDDIEALVRPYLSFGVQIIGGSSDDAVIPVGGSKFGGAPDVPIYFSWPWCAEIESNRQRMPLSEAQSAASPLWFIGQINLSQIPVSFEWLPGEGLILFFAALHREALSAISSPFDEWRVYYVKPEVELSRCEVPSLPDVVQDWVVEECDMMASEIAAIQVAKMGFERVVCLPDSIHRFAGIRSTDWDAFWAATYLTELNRSKDVLHMFGGFPEYLHEPEDLGHIGKLVYDGEGALSGERERLRSSYLGAWRNLMQFDTDIELGLQFPSNGRGYFFSYKEEWEKTLFLNQMR